MPHANMIRKYMLFGLLVSAMLVLAACAGGVPQSEYDTVKQQLADQEQQAADFQQELSDKVQEVAALQQTATAQAAEVVPLQTQAAGAGSDGVTVLIGAQVVPTSTPAPSPTPLPADFTPAPRPITPAEYYQPVGPFFLYVETLATKRVSEYGVAATVNCLNSSVFKRGQRIVWRFEIIDTATGVRITDKDEATVKIVLPNGDESNARWSQRAGGRVPDAPWMWNAIWDIPLDYPLGSLDYSIIVTAKDGRTMEWRPPALVGEDIGTDSRLQIVE